MPFVAENVYQKINDFDFSNPEKSVHLENWPELKKVDLLHDVHFAQVLTYLKLGHYKLGLLINFNVSSLKDGVRRVVNGV